MIAREGWVAAVQDAYAEGHTFFDVLTAVDLEDDGFEVVLRLWHPTERSAALLTTRCPRDDARVPSVIGVLPGAAWHERAVAEMFGIAFDGHETTHLLLPESFEGNPLRKDFVLAARVAKKWPGAKEPGESDADLARPRRRPTPPGAAFR